MNSGLTEAFSTAGGRIGTTWPSERLARRTLPAIPRRALGPAPRAEGGAPLLRPRRASSDEVTSIRSVAAPWAVIVLKFRSAMPSEVVRAPSSDSMRRGARVGVELNPGDRRDCHSRSPSPWGRPRSARCDALRDQRLGIVRQGQGVERGQVGLRDDDRARLARVEKRLVGRSDEKRLLLASRSRLPTWASMPLSERPSPNARTGTTDSAWSGDASTRGCR